MTAEQLAERLREDPNFQISQDEAREIVRKAFGSRPDLPPGEQFVRDLRDQLAGFRSE
jgi:hypothetical protein